MWWEIKWTDRDGVRRSVLSHEGNVKNVLSSLNHQGAKDIRLGDAPPYEEMMARKRAAGVLGVR